jgi:hypothetical protein
MTILFDDSVLADYHQFLVADALSGSDLPVNWTAGDLGARLLVGEQSLIAMTARNTVSDLSSNCTSTSRK